MIPKFQHLVASGNTFCPLFDVASGKISPGSIDGVQKFVDVIVVLELKLVLHLVYDYLQAVVASRYLRKN